MKFSIYLEYSNKPDPQNSKMKRMIGKRNAPILEEKYMELL